MIFKHPVILTAVFGLSGFLCKAVRDGSKLKINDSNNTNSNSFITLGSIHDFIAIKWHNTFKLNALLARKKKSDFIDVTANDLLFRVQEFPTDWYNLDRKLLLDTLIRNNGVRLTNYNDSGIGWKYQFNPGPLMVAYDDFTIYLRDEAEDPLGTFYWTIEVITKDNVDHYKHRHMEYLAANIGPSEKFRIENMRGFTRAVILTAARSSLMSEKYICKRCKESTLHDIFHQYIKFLTQQYELVHVCSGYLTAPDPGQTLPDNRCVTHTFKIIVCVNNDHTFRFECYKIPCDYWAAEMVDLTEFLVPRLQLEQDTGVVLIPTVSNAKIRDTVTHEHFQPTRADPWAARVKHSCLLCHPFQGQPYPDLKLKMF